MTATSSLRDTATIAAVAAIASAGFTYFMMRRPTTTTALTLDDFSTHHMNPILQKAGRAKEPRQATALYRNQPNATHVIRIALTGGPCAGKSSALSHLRQRATAEGFDVYCAPEVATLFLNSGVQLPTDHLSQEQFQFQKAICALQLALERNLTRIVQGTGRPSIIIFDRGLVDSKGYMNEDMWQQVLGQLTTSGATDTIPEHERRHSLFTVGVTEDYCLKRYDGVVHLVTAAEGAEEFYKSGQVTDDSGHAVIRNESKQEALKLDYKMREAWKNHSNHYIIGNEGTFQDKLDATVQVVLKLAEDTHTSESLRARRASCFPNV